MIKNKIKILNVFVLLTLILTSVYQTANIRADFDLENDNQVTEEIGNIVPDESKVEITDETLPETKEVELDTETTEMNQSLDSTPQGYGLDYDEYKDLISEDLNNYIVAHHRYQENDNWTYKDFFENQTNFTNSYDIDNDTIFLKDFKGVELFRNLSNVQFDIPVCDSQDLEVCKNRYDIKNFSISSNNIHSKDYFMLEIREDTSYFDYINPIIESGVEYVFFEELLNYKYESYLVDKILTSINDNIISDLELIVSPHAFNSGPLHFGSILNHNNALSFNYTSAELDYKIEYRTVYNEDLDSYEYKIVMNSLFTGSVLGPNNTWHPYGPNLSAQVLAGTDKKTTLEFGAFDTLFSDIESHVLNDSSLSQNEKTKLLDKFMRIEYIDENGAIKVINFRDIKESQSVSFESLSAEKLNIFFDKNLLDSIKQDNAPFEDLYISGDYSLEQDSTTENGSSFYATHYAYERFHIANKKDNYTVDFRLNDSEESVSFIKYNDIVENELITVPADKPIREGYEFVGWYMDKAGTKSWNFESNRVQDNLTLYAKWKENSVKNSYTVTFESNGGSLIDPLKVMDSSLITKPTNPVKNNYKFAGWYTDEDLINMWNFEQDVVTQDITLFAKWDDIETSNKYTVSFETHGGSTIDSIFVFEGNLITKPKDPVRKGYKFSGWYKDDTLITAWNFDENKVYNDTTIHAKWIKDKTLPETGVGNGMSLFGVSSFVLGGLLLLLKNKKEN